MGHTLHARGLFSGALMALSLALTLLIAACGTAPHGTSANSVLPAGTRPAPTSTTRSASSTAAPAAPAAPAAAVALSTDADHYTATSQITITIRNMMGTNIYALAHFTDCSMITLERLDSSGWQPVHPCMDAFPHPTIEQVAPGADVAVSLLPSAAGSDAGMGATTTWSAGTYRAVLVYTMSQSSAIGQGMPVYSSTFIVG